MSYNDVLGSFLLYCVCAGLCAQDRPQFVWQGQVDGTAILHLAGKRLAVQIQDGAPVERQKFHFSDALPQSQQTVRVEVLEGRGYVHVVDQPSIENHYTLAVAIEDRQPGSSFYSIALYWDASGNVFEQGAEKTDHVAWKGRVDEAAIISCHKQSCVSSAEQGAPVADEHFKFSRPLPDRDTEVRLEDPEGRGEIRLIEQPRQRNNYTARVSIRDPQGGRGRVFVHAGVESQLEIRRKSASDSRPHRPRLSLERDRGWPGARHAQRRRQFFRSRWRARPLAASTAKCFGHYRRVPISMPTIQKLRGRGRVSIVESPSEKNNYRLVFEIDDPEPGADYYEVELDW